MKSSRSNNIVDMFEGLHDVLLGFFTRTIPEILWTIAIIIGIICLFFYIRNRNAEYYDSDMHRGILRWAKRAVLMVAGGAVLFFVFPYLFAAL